MIIAMIAAVAENRTIGFDNRLPWRLPEDLRYFKQVTMGKPIIMGRKSFDSIGKPLPGRANIVVTRNTQWSNSGVMTAHSLDRAITLARDESDNSAREVMIIGGAELYRQALSITQRIYLTRIHRTFRGDAFFPELNENDWCEVSRDDRCASEDTNLRYSFCVLERRVPTVP